MKCRSKSLIFFAAGVALAFAAPSVFAGSLGVFTSDSKGFDTHTFYYDDGKEVTLIDTQFIPSLTENMVREVKSKTNSPITRVIVTHANPDKFNGLPYLHQLGVESITSTGVARDMPIVHQYKENFWVNVAKAFEPGTYPSYESVKTQFDDQQTIKLKSGETISLFELKSSGVTNKQVVVRIDQTGDLIVGDLVHTKAHLWLEGGLKDGRPHADLPQWSRAVGELTQLVKGKPNATIYGGRGVFTRAEEAIREQQRYLGRIQEIVKSYMEELGERKAELGDATKSKAHYKEVERRLVDAFPEYSLPYMVTYSVYGLVGTLAR